MWLQLGCHHSPWPGQVLTRRLWGVAEWGSFSTALPGRCCSSPHTLQGPPVLGHPTGPHSRDNRAQIHFRPFLWSLCTTEVSLCQEEDDAGVESLQQSSGFPDCSLWLLLTRWINWAWSCAGMQFPSPFPLHGAFLLSIGKQWKIYRSGSTQGPKTGAAMLNSCFLLVSTAYKIRCLGDVHNWCAQA